MAESENTLVTLVCQRCSQPIKLNRSVAGAKLYEAVKPLEKEMGLGGKPSEGKLDQFLEKVQSSRGEYDKLSNELQFVTECFRVLSESGEIDHPLCVSCPEAAMQQYRVRASAVSSGQCAFYPVLFPLGRDTGHGGNVRPLSEAPR